MTDKKQEDMYAAMTDKKEDIKIDYHTVCTFMHKSTYINWSTSHQVPSVRYIVHCARVNVISMYCFPGKQYHLRHLHAHGYGL